MYFIFMYVQFRLHNSTKAKWMAQFFLERFQVPVASCQLPVANTHIGSIGSRGFLSAIVQSRTEERKIKMAQWKRNNWNHYTCIGRILLHYLNCFHGGLTFWSKWLLFYIDSQFIVSLFAPPHRTSPFLWRRTMDAFEIECHFNAFTAQLSHLRLICIPINSHPRVGQP